VVSAAPRLGESTTSGHASNETAFFTLSVKRCVKLLA
jgi:hypothetical protein